jgi:hypothetical protein
VEKKNNMKLVKEKDNNFFGKWGETKFMFSIS